MPNLAGRPHLLTQCKPLECKRKERISQLQNFLRVEHIPPPEHPDEIATAILRIGGVKISAVYLGVMAKYYLLI